MPRGTTARAPWALLAALGGCLFYAYAAEGATELVSRSRLELALAATSLAAAAACLYGRGLRFTASRAGLAGLVLMTAFAAWAAASIAWSVAPDRSWTEANTVLAYVLAAFVGVTIGSSLLRAAERVGLTIAIATLPIALYALGGKTVPGLDFAGLSFDHTASFNRLSAPLGYWNALALACVSGLLPLLRCAVDPWRRPAARVAALVGVFVFALVLELTYSRGGVLALVVGATVLIALSTERVRTLAALALVLLATAAPLVIALSSADLTTNDVPLSARTDDGVVLLVATVVAAAVLAALGRVLIALEAGATFTPARGRAIGRPAALAVAAVLAIAVAGAVITGGAGRAFDDFTDVRQAASQTDPNRLLSGNSGNRWVWWLEAAGAFSDRPVAGWGAGSFPVTHLLYRKQQLQVQQPHSVPLQWLAEDGLVGFLLAAGALAALLAAGLSRVRSLPWAPAGAPGDRGAAAALFAVAAAWVAQSLVEWSWDIPAVTLPLFIALGVLAARPRAGDPRPAASRGPALALASGAFVAFVLSAGLPAVAQSQASAALERVAVDGASEATLSDAAAQAELAARLNPLALDALEAAASIAARRNRDEEARDYLLQAVDRQPYDSAAWIRLAGAEFDRGDREGLRRATGRAVDLDPIGLRPILLAFRAAIYFAPPGESATATGAPLPTEVPGS